MNDNNKYTVPVKNQNIQIPLMLFAALARVVLFDDPDPELLAICKKGINDKFDAMYRRQLYSTYRNTNLTTEEREQARVKYLDEVGIPHDFWWPSDWETNNYK